MPAAIDDYAAIARRLRVLNRRETTTEGAPDLGRSASREDGIPPATPGNHSSRTPQDEGPYPDWPYYFWGCPRPSSTA